MRRVAIVLLGLLAASSCSKQAPKPAGGQGLVLQPMSSSPGSGHAPPALSTARTHLVGSITRKAIGPFLGRSTYGGLVAWITPAQRGGGQELVVVPLGQDGAPFGEPHAVATVPQEATALVVRPSGTAHGGWLVAWSALLDRGESLSVFGVGADGTPHATPFDVQRTSDHVKWVDIVPTASGGMCVWAEETPAGDANILVAPLDGDGKPRGQPVRVARGVLGWATARDSDGVALALVGPGGDGSGGAGALSWWRLDADGHPRAAPLAVGMKSTVSSDVDLVAAGSGWLLAWTDRTGEDAQVTLAAIDASGHVAGPRHAMEAVGGASLVGLASGPAGVALAWAEPRGRARKMRSIHLAGVSLEGPVAQPVTSVDFASGSSPELVATEHGFALLSSAQVCGVDAGTVCDGGLAPTFVRLDGRLTPTQTEPLMVGDHNGPAALGWGLGCLGDGCVALAANGDTPTSIFTVDLSVRASPYRPPTTPPVPLDAPRVTGVVTLASGQPFADLATARVGDATLLATITSAVDARPTRHEGVHQGGAVISVRPFDGEGQPLGTLGTITSRALSAGGVALAGAPRPEDGAALAWVARDDGDAQVHIAHLDKRGRRINEVQLTTEKGDASDVAVAWAGDGWLVAWVDARDGNGEVYATRVGRDLQRTAREERITKAPGDAGDVALVVKDDTAWLAWSDPRESPREGLADIYAVTLHTRDARRAGDEVRVLATAAHSRSPAFSLVGGGVLVAWVEDPPQGLEAHAAAMVARLDGAAHVLGPPQALQLADSGNPAALAIEPDGDGARVFVARSNRDDVSLDALALRSDGSTASSAWRLLDLDAPATFDVALAAAGDAVFFDDVGASAADHRVRRAAVTWRR